MRIRELLDRKGSFVATISQSCTVGDVLARLAEHGVGALVVSDDGRAVAGIVSERDIVRRLHEDGAGVLDRPVTAIMTTAVHTCGLDDVVDQLAALMTAERVRHVPVVADGVLTGIVSIGDVVKTRIAELEQEYGHLYEYFTSGR